MKIGLTYDLRSWYLDRGYSMEDTAEFDKQETVDALDSALVKMGFETEHCMVIIKPDGLINKFHFLLIGRRR